MARELAVGVKENRACEALCRVITQCGEKLREHFPRQVNDIQELPDEVITE
jgi:putative membrane protein